MKRILLALSFVLLLGIYLFTSKIGNFPIVSGESMEPNYYNGNLLYCDKQVYENSSDVERFDVVVIQNGYFKIIKRVIGLPGDTLQIKDKKIYINGEILEENYGKEPIEDEGIAIIELHLKDNEFFVLGDNRNHSSDSRTYGIFNFNDIEGKITKTLKE